MAIGSEVKKERCPNCSLELVYTQGYNHEYARNRFSVKCQNCEASATADSFEQAVHTFNEQMFGGNPKCTCGEGDSSPSHYEGCPALGPQCTCNQHPHKKSCPVATNPGSVVAEGFPSPAAKLPGVKHVRTLPEGEECVAMTCFVGKDGEESIIVATTSGVFYLDSETETLKPIPFEAEKCEGGG